MAWAHDQRKHPLDVEWMLQIQHKPGDWWHDHTRNLYSRQKAYAFMAERQAANPTCKYRLIRMTTTYKIEPKTVRP
jgi:hypothetical protein